MPSWKKVILSGSSARLNHVTASGNISGSAISTGSFGNVSIVDFPNLSASLARADSLGDHLASQNLNLANNAIESASRILADAISGSTITASIGDFADLLADFVTSSIGDFNTLTASLAQLGVIEASDITASNLTVTKLTGGSPLEITASNFTVTPSGSLTLSGSSTASFDRIIGSGIFSLGGFTDVSASLATIVPSGSVFDTAVSKSAAQFGFGQGSEVTALSQSLQGRVTLTESSASAATQSINVLVQASGGFSTRIASNKSDIDQLQGAGNTQGVGESNTPTFAGLTIDGNITGSIISASAITASNILSLVEGIDISDLSQSLASRIAAEEGEAEGSVLSSSAQIASDISGSFTSLSQSLTTRISNEENNVDALQTDSASFSTRITNFTNGNVTLVSGSSISTGSFGHVMHEGKPFDTAVSESVAQFGFGQGTEVTALSSSIQSRVSTIEGKTLVSSSTQIASDISGSLSNTAISSLSAGIISSSGDTVDLNGKKIEFANVYSNEGDLPSASDNHGMFAHVHGTGLAYFAHAGAWHKLALYSGNVSSSAQLASDISGSFNSLSQSLAARITAEEGEAEGSVLSSSAQIASDISGAFSATSGGLEQRITNVEAGSTSKTLVSSSAQLASDISGSLSGTAIAALGVGIVSGSSQIGDILPAGTLSSSAQIASDISGSFGAASSSIATEINTLQSNVSTLESDATAKVITQSVASATWPVTHSLGTKYPAVTVWDSTDNVIIPSNIKADTTDTLTISFEEAISGKVSVTLGAGGINPAGAFTSTISSSISTRLTTVEGNIGGTVVSSSAQLASDISGAFAAVSGGFSDRLDLAEAELSLTLLSGSAQVKALLPSGVVSGSSQLPANIISGSSQLPSGIISGSSQLPTGTVSGSSQITDVITQTYVSQSAAAAGFGSGGGGGSGTGGIFVTGSGLSGGDLGNRHTLADLNITGSITIEASGSKTGSTVFDVIGNSGTLFQLNDVSTGSLFAVNKASGVPVVESFSDGKTEIGPFNNKVIIDGNVSGSSTSTASFGALLVNGSTVGGVTSGDIANLGAGIISGSSQLPSGIISGSAQVASNISGSLGANATLIRSLTASSISGSLSATALAALSAGIVSSSTQISASAAASGFGAGAGGGGIFASGSGISQKAEADMIVTGSILIQASGSKTGSTLFDVVGNSGTLFQLIDVSTGSLFAVNKASGVPIVESFSDGKTEIGPFNNKVIIDGNVSGSSISTGSFGQLKVGKNIISPLNISGSWKGELSSSNQTFVGGGVSGSSLSTASFGYIELNGEKVTAGEGTVTEVEGTGNVNGITLTGTVTTNGQLSLGGTFAFSTANKSAISGSSTSLSQSIASRIDSVESGAVTAASIRNANAGVLSGSAQIASNISGSLSNTAISSLDAGIISGSSQLPSGIISGSSQLPSGIISGSSQLPTGTVSGSSQITDVVTQTYVSASAAAAGFGSGGGGGGSFTASGISGSFVAASSSIATDIDLLQAGSASTATEINVLQAASGGFSTRVASLESGGGGGGSSIFTSGAGISQKTLADIIVTGSIEINPSGSAGGNTLFAANGSSGSLFSVVDESSTLFSIAKMNGIPVFEVSSSGRMQLGSFSNPIIVDTLGSLSGSSTSTGSFAKLMVGGDEMVATTATSIAALGAGIISGSSQLPSGIISGSSQLPSGTISGSSQLPNGIISGSSQLPSGVVSSSAQIASDVSGAFAAASGGFSTRVASLESGGGGGGSSIFKATGSFQSVTDDLQVTGSLVAKSTGSNTTIFSVDGVSEDMLTITDSLSGSLFSVVRTSGIPVMEVFSDGKVQLANLPTSDPGEPGMLYNDSGTLKISL